MRIQKAAIRDVTKWVSQGFGTKKKNLDSSPLSPVSLHLAHIVHSAHIICCYTLQLGNLLSFHFYTIIFKMCKNIGTYSECLPSERACHCKHVCMQPHISDIHSLLCRWVSNTEAFKMLIHWAAIFVCLYNTFIHCSLNGGIPSLLYFSVANKWTLIQKVGPCQQQQNAPK